MGVPMRAIEATGMIDEMRPAVCLTNPIGVHRHVVLAFIVTCLSYEPQRGLSAMADLGDAEVRRPPKTLTPSQVINHK